MCDVLQHYGLTGLRWRNNQAALAEADGGNQVDNARSQVLAGGVVALQAQALVRVQRCQVLEQDLVLGLFGQLEIDRIDLKKSKVALGFFGRADRTDNGIAGAQVKAADLRGRHINVVRPGQVRAIGGAQEAEAVLQDLHHPFAGDVFALAGLGLEQRENQVLLAHAAATFKLHGDGHFYEFGRGLAFQFGKVHER